MALCEKGGEIEMLKCFECFDCFKGERFGAFACGVLFGTAGLKVLASRDARKVYVQAVAAGLRARDCMMTTASQIQEAAEDILEEAKLENQFREAEEESELCWTDAEGEPAEAGKESGDSVEKNDEDTDKA